MKIRKTNLRGLSGRSSSLRGLCTITFCVLAAGQVAQASTALWDGAVGSPGDWDADNWSGGGGTGGAPLAGDTLTFAGIVQTGTNNNFAADTSFAGINITNPNASPVAFTLAGARITLGGDITTIATAVTGGPLTRTHAISLDMVLDGNRTITTSSITAGTNNNQGMSHNLSISGIISEDATPRNLTKAGVGTLTLSGANNYSGTTTVSGGVLQLDNANALPGGIGTTGGTSALILNGGVISLGNGDFTRALGTGIVQVDISGDNSGFAANGADRNVNLGGAVTPASVSFGSGNFFTAGSTLVLGATTATHTVTFQNPIDMGSTGRFFRADNGAANVDGRLSGAISGTGSFSKTGTGTLELTGANDYTGATQIDNGTLGVNTLTNVGTASSLGNPLLADSIIRIGDAGNSGSLLYTGSASATDRQIQIGNGTANNNIGGATISSSGAGILEFTNAIFNNPVNTGTGTSTTTTTRTLNLRGTNTGLNRVAGVIANNLQTETPIVAVTKEDAGTWVLEGANTYTGATQIIGGTLTVSKIADSGESNIGFGTTMRIGGSNTTGTLNYTGTGSTTDRRVNVGNTTGVGVAIINNNGGNGGSGLVFSNPDFSIAQGVSSGGTGSITLGGTNTDANEIRGIINNSTSNNNRTVSLTKTDAGRWILAGANTYTGTTVINNGTLEVKTLDDAGVASSLGAGTSVIRIGDAGTTGTLLYTGSANSDTNRQIQIGNGFLNISGGATIRSSGAGIVEFTNAVFNTPVNSGNTTTAGSNTRTLTLGGTNTGLNRIAGVIANNTNVETPIVAVTKEDAGQWILEGTNTHTGATTVTAGTMLLNGNSPLANGAVNVNGGTLGGSGTLGGAVTVAATGSLAPGNAAVGTLTLNSTLDVSAQADGSGKLNFELGPIATSDKIAVAGALTIGTDVLNFSDFNFSTLAGLENGTYKLITSGGFSGTLDPVTVNLTGTLGAGPATGTLQRSGGGAGNDLELVVNGAVSDPFTTWAGTGVNGFDADANGDGVDNGLAWLLGAPNKEVSALDKLPVVTQTGGSLKLTFDMLPASKRGGAKLLLEHSGDLGIGDQWSVGVLVPDATGGSVPVTFTVTDSDLVDPANPLDVEATIASTEALAGKLFGRLKAEK